MLPPLIIFLIVLSLLVFIHEFGHFLAAKKIGIWVEEFGFGYPPRIWGKKIGGTIYSINWIPFGGFVKLYGQEIAEKKNISKQKIKQAFFSQSKKAKVLVLLAGILGNVCLGVICFYIIYAKLGIPSSLGYLKVLEVVENSPAFNAGLKANDQIVSVNGIQTGSLDKFITEIEKNKGQEVIVQTQRGEIKILDRDNPPEGQGRLGVLITDTERLFYPWYKMIGLGVWSALKEALGWTLLIVQGLALTIKQLFMGIAPEVAGPIGIFQLTSAAAKQGILELVQFVGILSINLAVLNLVPFPALDGGHLFFLFVGGLIKEKKRAKIEQTINMAGFIFLISLMILVTINDVVRLLKTSFLWDRILSLLPF